MRLALSLVIVSSACSMPLHTARLDPLAEPMEREEIAAERVTPWAPTPHTLVPGAYKFASGQTAEGAILAGLAASEVGVGVALTMGQPADQRDFEQHQGLLVPWVALQDVVVYSYADALMDS